MNDLLKSIKAHLYEKATSPLFGIFAISWALWNYKFILVLISSMKVADKLAYISEHFFVDISSSLLTGMLYPILTTVLVIFVYPYPAKFVYEFSRKKQKELREIKQTIEDETPLTVEESRKIRRELIELELKYEKELEYRTTENKRLKEMIDELNSDIPSAPSSEQNATNVNSSHEKPDNVTHEQFDLLLFISSQKELIKEIEILEHAKTDHVKTKYNLGELVGLKLAKIHYPNGIAAYEVTHAGRKALVSEGLIK